MIWHCPVCIYCGVTFVCFANSTLITSFLKLPFLSSFFLASLSSPVSFSFLVSVWLLFCHVGDLVDCTPNNLMPAFLAYCWCITTVLHACKLHGTVVSECLCFSTPAVQYCYHFAVIIEVVFANSSIRFSLLSLLFSPLSLSLFRNAIYPHSTLLYEVRSNKCPSSPSWLYASVESASCLEYKLYLVTCKQFSVLWLSKSNQHMSIPVWFVFYLTVKSDHRFTCLLRAQLLRSTTKEAEGQLHSGTATKKG